MTASDVNGIGRRDRVTYVPVQQRAGTDMSGRSRCVIHTLPRIRGVLIHLVCMIIACLQRSWIISSQENKEAAMIGLTYRGYVVGVIIENTILMVQRGAGVGAKKVLPWGKRPAGQTFVCAREIR